MEMSYDSRYNIAYIRIRKKTGNIETIKISDELNIDISPNGKVYGFELLNANEQLQIKKGGEFVLIDESKGKTKHLSMV